QAEDGIRDKLVTGVQTCALPILIAATASSNTPSLQTDSSCRSRSPSMCTTQAKYGDGLNLSSFFGSSSALVHRKTNFLRLISSRSEERRVGKQCESRSGPTQA